MGAQLREHLEADATVGVDWANSRVPEVSFIPENPSPPISQPQCFEFAKRSAKDSE